MVWNKDRITGLSGFLFGLFLLIAALNISNPPTATSDVMGPRAFPIIISVIVILCSLGVFFFNKKNETSHIRLQDVSQMFIYVGVLTVFLLTAPYLGLVISFFLLLFVLMMMIQREKVIKTVFISACISISLYLIFELLLNINIPAWPSIFN